MELLLIRHGLPLRVENADGPADPPLAPAGHDQAERLAAWLEPEGVTGIYVSPMQRARETAAPLERRLDTAATVVDDIAEFDRHSDTYVPLEELKAENDPRWLELLANGYLTDDDMDPVAFQRDVVDAIEQIVADNRGGRVAVVCHGGVILAWVGHVLGLTDFMFMQPDYTSITRFQCSSRGHRSVVTLNETPHLRTYF